jgi:type I restriction enzyme S subunit
MLDGFTRTVPLLPEQKAIAAVLGSLDDKIELLREQNETLEALAQTLFNRWFIDFNFPDENGNPYKDSGGKMIPSELGEVPEGWKVGNFEEDGFYLTMGQSPSGSSYNETGTGTLFFQGRSEFGWRFPTPRLHTTEPSRMAHEGDILLSVRAPVGDINLAMRACCVGRRLCAMSHHLRSYALYKVKSLTRFFDQYNQEGTVFGSISKKDFERRELIIPQKEIAFAFDQFGKPIDAKIKTNTEQINNLTKLRDTLLPKLMKGEIRVLIQ